MKLRISLILILVCLGLGQAKEHWVATWTTAQPLARYLHVRGGGPPRAAQGFDNQTVRMIVCTSIGGARVRIRLSNAFDSQPVAVGAAHIAIRSKDSEIVSGSDRPLAFDGRPGCTVGPGMVILSDPVHLSIPYRW